MLSGLSRYLDDSSRRDGAKGIQKSLFLIIALIFSILDQSAGLVRIERFPRARAPHSIRPENLATTLLAARTLATI